LTSQKEVVEVLLFAGFLEGEDALYDNEDDYANAKQVNLGSIVGLSLLDLGSHVSHGASVRLEVVDAFVASETEIGNFQIKIVVYKNVLELEVTMHAAEVVHVLNCVDHLAHKEAASVLSHSTHGLAKVERRPPETYSITMKTRLLIIRPDGFTTWPASPKSCMRIIPAWLRFLRIVISF